MTEVTAYTPLFCTVNNWFDSVNWVNRSAKIIDSKGNTIFELKDIECPEDWSQMALNVVASKYFYPGNHVDAPETSVKALISRVVTSIASWAYTDGYLPSQIDCRAFENDLGWLLINQYGSFNSPVWFNVGIATLFPGAVTPCTLGYHYDYNTHAIIQSEENYVYPQVSACFIQPVVDDMESIMDLAKAEALIFKHGSGTGTDLSTLRSTQEMIAGGGAASGPLSFLKIYDTIASVVRSGGRIRRAAKLNVLSVEHPDIKDWIFAKVKEEKKANSLIAQGYSSDFGGAAYSSVWYQNENLSVKISDRFMDAVMKDDAWQTKMVKSGKPGPSYQANELFNWMAECAHVCGDPGLQFNDTINKWNTVINDGVINTSNRCQPGVATVLTPEGIKTFDDIDKGSIIWSGTKWTTVINKQHTGKKPVYKYITNAGSFIGTENHRVVCNGEKIEVKDATAIDIANYPSDYNDISNNPIPAKATAKINSKKYSGILDVYDITVDCKEHTYWTGGLLVSNCGEFVFIDGSACNLASLNLMKFAKFDTPTPTFDFDTFEKAIRVFVLAQDVIINRAAYPTEIIAKNSIAYRPIGLGYANLGALLMAFGLSYGDKAGCDFAAIITAYMTGFAYKMSNELAIIKGAFDKFESNRESMFDVLSLHYKAVKKLVGKQHKKLVALWQGISNPGVCPTGFRNAQVTLLAPCGTIGFLMDCDTTGVEPELALVKYKTMVGGGVAKLVNNTIPIALNTLGYTPDQIKVISESIIKEGTIESCKVLKPEHLPIFDCALRAEQGKRFLTWKQHVNMVAAIQPFLSGAISKTVNLPSDVTVDTVKQVYLTAWQSGLKGITIYRDGCKGNQPLSTSAGKKKDKEKEDRIRRRRLPATRDAKVHKFKIGGHEGYFTVGLYSNEEPGELFINMSKEGSTIGGLMDAFGTAISLCLQYGVPLKALVNKFMLSRFEPSGFTGNPEIPMATSLIDYIFRWLDLKYTGKQEAIKEAPPIDLNTAIDKVDTSDNPLCDNCGSMTVRNGACFKCPNCGTSLGCS